MGRLVNCFDTGQKIDRDSAYIEECSAGRRRFWSSKEAYDKWFQECAFRNNCVNKLSEMLGYNTGLKIPGYIFKKLDEYKSYGYDVIYSTILIQTDSISWAINNKNFQSEIGKINYVFAIIGNNILAEFTKKQRLQQAILTQQKTVIVSENLDIGTTRKGTGVSKLLGDL